MTQRYPTGGGGGAQMTPLVRNTLIVLVSLYVLQLILIYWLHLPLQQWVYLQPIFSGAWRPWQLVTALLFNRADSPLFAALEWAMIYFFAGTVEGMLGRKRFLQAIGFSVGAALVLTTLLDAVGALPSPIPFVGIDPIITAMIVIFGLSIPHARILLFFVLPVKAVWIAWGSGLLSLLNFLMSRDLFSSMTLFGWVGAWLWMNSEEWLGRFKRKKKTRDMERDLSRFKVYQGGRDKDEYIH